MRWRQIARSRKREDGTPLPSHVSEAGAIKPSGSLTADQWRKRSERQARVQQQMRDEDARHAAKRRDLSGRLAHQD